VPRCLSTWIPLFPPIDKTSFSFLGILPARQNSPPKVSNSVFHLIAHDFCFLIHTASISVFWATRFLKSILCAPFQEYLAYPSCIAPCCFSLFNDKCSTVALGHVRSTHSSVLQSFSTTLSDPIRLPSFVVLSPSGGYLRASVNFLKPLALF